jgi:hypothetical protein
MPIKAVKPDTANAINTLLTLLARDYGAQYTCKIEAKGHTIVQRHPLLTPIPEPIATVSSPLPAPEVNAPAPNTLGILLGPNATDLVIDLYADKGKDIITRKPSADLISDVAAILFNLLDKPTQKKMAKQWNVPHGSNPTQNLQTAIEKGKLQVEFLGKITPKPFPTNNYPKSVPDQASILSRLKHTQLTLPNLPELSPSLPQRCKSFLPK